MSVESGNGFDRWLDEQLQNQAVKQSGPSPMPAQAQYHASYLQGGPHMSVLAKAASVVSAKGAIGLAVAALAVGAAGVASEAAITGSANPTNWGQQVVLQVDKCKDALTPGSHGIGECVSTFASKHGKEESSERASEAREHASGARTDHPTGKPTDHPGGKPSGVPPTGHTS